MNDIRVLLADDHGVVRDGLRLLINSQPDMSVTGEVPDATAVIDVAARGNYDVVVLDLSMPGGGGLPAIPRLREVAPSTKIVVLTMHDQPAYRRKAVDAGAVGYVAKRVAGNALLDVIRAAHEGRPCLDEPTTSAPRRRQGAGTGVSSLSRRELEVLSFVASGYTNQQTADQLGLSVKTVEGYRARVTRKLGVRTRADLVRVALDNGLLSHTPEVLS